MRALRRLIPEIILISFIHSPSFACLLLAGISYRSLWTLASRNISASRVAVEILVILGLRAIRSCSSGWRLACLASLGVCAHVQPFLVGIEQLSFLPKHSLYALD